MRNTFLSVADSILDTDDTPSAESPRAYGYFGRALRVDVSTCATRAIPLPEQVLRNFIGGAGLGTWLLLNERTAQLDAFAPEAPLVFAFSPLVGSPLTTSAKFAVVSKSPLTNRINDSLASSHFAIAGKRTGHDALVIVGRAEVPSILIIEEGNARLEPAGELWGMNIPATEAALHERFCGDAASAVIGPAGERQIRYATLSHDGRHAGRGGTGAVLGSKNIKAIIVRGSRRCDWAKPKELVAASKDLSRRSFGPATAKYRELGTASNLLVFNRLATLPTRNFQQGTFEGASDLSVEQLSETRAKSRKSCAACTIGCEHLYEVTDKAGDKKSVRLEYENLFALGPLCGVRDSDVVLTASRRCDELGLDTISAGGSIAFGMECAERGLIDAPWLRFGDGAALLRALDEIGDRTGIGELLSEGTRRAAKRIGQGAETFAIHVKGLELPGYEPRSLQTMALGFAVGARGADHNRSGAYEADFSETLDRLNPGVAAAARAIETENRAALIDSLILCKFLRGVFANLYAEASDLLNLVTGWNTNAGELRITAERIIAARKQFNILAGWTPAEDTLPDRFFDETLPEETRARITRENLSAQIAAYNTARTWSTEGWISRERLSELGLSDFAATTADAT